MTATTTKKIGRYRIERVIGRGAMGIVYLAHDDIIKRRVAIKSLRMDRLETDMERLRAREYFLHEARVVGNLNHAHITSIYDMGIQDGLPYIVMEYIEGKDVKELITSGNGFCLKEKLSFLSMIARALHYAHQRGILHRDIKPANIMILKEGYPKITDFGIAHIMNAGKSFDFKNPVQEDGFIPGTPLNMSPEQIMRKELDQRSDIYSLGTMSYQWISGQKPFSGKDLEEQLHAVIEKAPTPLSKLCQVDSGLEEIVNRAMAKDPVDRFQSAEEFSDALELYIDKTAKEKASEGSKVFSYDKVKIVKRLKKKYSFFADFADDELFDIFKLCRTEKFDKGDHLIRQGTSGMNMYIIISGAVTIMTDSDGKCVKFDTLEGGSCVGEMSMIDRMPRSASVVAIRETTALAINEIVLRLSKPKLCLKLYRNLASILSERLRSNDAKYLDLIWNSADTSME